MHKKIIHLGELYIIKRPYRKPYDRNKEKKEIKFEFKQFIEENFQETPYNVQNNYRKSEE